MAVDYALRQALAADARFLYALNRQTMRDYVCRTWGGWNEKFQAKYFAEQFDAAANQLIVVDDQPIGVLSVMREPGRFFIRALEILPAWQGRGIGTAIVVALLAEARDRGLPLELQVLKVNAGAHRLYERLGFQPTGETTTHIRMRAI
jgi:GNAT superfamily N-acetyltransferase